MSPRRVLWPIYLSVAISYLGVGLVVPLISIVLSERGSNTFIVGLVGTTMFAAMTAAALPVGLATDRFGPRIILVSGLVVYGGAILLFAFTSEIWQFFLIRVVEGAGGAAISVATETMISHSSEEGDRSRRMSYYALSVGLGWSLGPMAGTSLFQVHPAVPFIVCFALSLTAAILVATLGPRVSSHDHGKKGITRALNFRLLVPISSGALYGFMMASLVTLLPLYLARRNITNVLMGSIITAVIIGTIASQIPIGWAADVFGPRRVLILAALILSGLFALLPLGSQFWHFIVIGVLIGAVGGSLYPVGLSMIGALVGVERLGAATSLFSLAFGLGSLLGPSISGLAMGRFGDNWLFYFPSLLTALFAVGSITVSVADSRSTRHNTVW